MVDEETPLPLPSRDVVKNVLGEVGDVGDELERRPWMERAESGSTVRQ
jgi:hypothetical protein